MKISMNRQRRVDGTRLLAVSIALILAVFSACSRNAEESRDAAPQKTERGDRKPDFPFRGRIIFQSDTDGDNEIYALTKDGVQKLTDNAWSDEYPRWSPDGTRIAFTANPRGNFDIFIMSEDGSIIRPVTDSPADETEPAWFPDGSALAFTRDDNALWKIDFKTKETSRIIPDFSRTHGLSDLSPAAPLLAFTGKRLLGWDVFVHDLESGRSTALTAGGKSCRPHFSKDGRKIAFVSSKADGKGDVWTMNPDGSEKTRLTERDETSDYYPAWSPDGKYIVFCSSVEHSYKKGRWSLFLVNVNSKSVIPLFSEFERSLFPDWH
jgi:Tol biopolymer transport system component